LNRALVDFRPDAAYHCDAVEFFLSRTHFTTDDTDTGAASIVPVRIAIDEVRFKTTAEFIGTNGQENYYAGTAHGSPNLGRFCYPYRA
jgi:hypothetical protein